MINRHLFSLIWATYYLAEYDLPESKGLATFLQILFSLQTFMCIHVNILVAVETSGIVAVIIEIMIGTLGNLSSN